jgi:hypothetical protein
MSKDIGSILNFFANFHRDDGACLDLTAQYIRRDWS